jgi:malate synthase
LHVIKICHRRGAFAMGGMAAQIPIKNNPAANEAALAKVRADKEREATDGHDGTWVAHPGLVPIALQAFDKHMPQPNQVARQRPDVTVTAAELLAAPPGAITEAGVRLNLSVGVQYLEAWLGGLRLRAALQPHGGRGDRGDLPRAALAVAPLRRVARRRPPDRRRAL